MSIKILIFFYGTVSTQFNTTPLPYTKGDELYFYRVDEVPKATCWESIQSFSSQISLLSFIFIIRKVFVLFSERFPDGCKKIICKLVRSE